MKVAVTVPEDTLRAVEKRRRALGLSRSAVVSAALDAWLADQAMTAEERRYVTAYLKHPETGSEIAESTALGLAAVESWDPWPEAPAHARSRKQRTSAKRARGEKAKKAKR